MPIEEKAKYADVVVDTDCDIAEVESRVLKLWRRLQLLKIGEVGLREEIKEVLTQREKKSIPEKGSGAAAVLIPLYQRDGEWHILFTKRTERVEYHKGQISFPGGRWEEEDKSLLATALRESFEEIGLRAENVELLGELDDFVTLTSNFVVTPFVAVIPYPYEFKVSREEVEELIEVPLTALLKRDNFREEPVAGEGQLLPFYIYQYEDHSIWGATARMLKQFLDVIFG
jgi:8-oxo-dGTP pyrophosphatase MutT (NUDIX family)